METRLFGDGQAVGNGGHDLWLKAATIAVPIAGGCILVLLVLLAIRMLRRDRENNNDVLMGNNYTVPTNRNDFQIRSVWGKSRQIQHEPAYHHVPQHQHNNNNIASINNTSTAIIRIKWRHFCTLRTTSFTCRPCRKSFRPSGSCGTRAACWLKIQAFNIFEKNYKSTTRWLFSKQKSQYFNNKNKTLFTMID
ncbi:putative BMP and activin membrane-bound inhibitor [Daphnia magna]|uniref:Putative BMP and activin membrane-bound inhibitor n=1 Tax=Daphnia magna TaxID=35525 RepID=A0A162RLL9_9CRUS|nr:putative BMP and activin membrane-bound inhibitor [Daphnia magna]